MDGVLGVAGGWVRGKEEGDVWAFLGIPYARAPQGPLRWRPPERPEPWSGVRDAVDPGPIAPQTRPTIGSAIPGDPAEQSEDCLHLSVWTPGAGDGRRPVMVWIHGGGFTTGTAGSALYHGADLARRTGAVVVSVNYRLGALGFLAHESLSGPGGAFANWGLLDQVAALRWVRDHIAQFGGDPGNVLVFGESAGAMSICALLAMPAARGLFHRAAIQSGPPYTFTAARAAEAAGDLIHELGIAELRREVLEAVPAVDLVQAAAELQNRRPRPGELPLPFLPVVDGRSLPAAPLESVASGAAAEVPLLVGTNRDEVAFFSLADPAILSMDEAQMLRRLRHSAPSARVEDLVGAYRAARARRGEALTPREVWVGASSDLVFRWPSLRLAAAQRAHQRQTFVYLFTWVTPVLGGALGACHALEIPFVFGTVRHPTVAALCGGGWAAEELSADMQAAWVSFARSGDPSCDRNGAWDPWDPDRRATMVFGEETKLHDAPRDEELAVWEALAPLPGATGAP